MTHEVKIYTRKWCGYCTAALGLLRGKNIAFEEIDCTDDPAKRRWLVEASGQSTVPQIFIDGSPVGGFSELRQLEQSGRLDELMR